MSLQPYVHTYGNCSRVQFNLLLLYRPCSYLLLEKKIRSKFKKNNNNNQTNQVTTGNISKCFYMRERDEKRSRSPELLSCSY